MRTKKIITALILAIFFFQGIAQSDEIKKMYVGTFTSEGAEGIYLCNFNLKTGDLTLEKTFKGIDNPSFLRISSDRQFVYAVSRATKEVEQTGGFVVAYKIQKNGALKFINKQVSHGFGPCHVDVSPDGKYVAIATYASGTTSLYPVNADGSLEPASSTIVNKGSSVDKNRQNEPHAHSIKFSPFDHKIYSADLGTDKLNCFVLSGDKLVPASQPFVKIPDGAGPRHFEFHPDGSVIYVINELNSTISTLKKSDKKWKTVQNVSTLPNDFEGLSYCADIHISKDGKFLYGSNRGHNSIAVFSVHKETKKLELMKTVSVEGDWPRNFVISPCRQYLLVANQKSGNITVFKIDPKTGLPSFTGKEIKLPSPVCLEIL